MAPPDEETVVDIGGGVRMRFRTWHRLPPGVDMMLLGAPDADVVDPAERAEQIARRSAVVRSTPPGPAVHPRAAAVQWEREREALIACARALAGLYAGSVRPGSDEPEARAAWDAMRTAYSALGVLDIRDLPGPPEGGR